MRPTHLLALRIVVLAWGGMLLIVLVAFAVLSTAFTATSPVWTALPVVAGVADLVLVPSVGATVRPLPLTADATAARRIAIGVLRNVIFLRLALAELPALLGLVATVVTGSLMPLAVGIVFAVPLILVFAYPTERVVDGVRRRLEEGGAQSYLWEALTDPA